MYSLLIVDDEIHAVRGVKACIEWEQHGISEVHSAYNIRQAKEILESSSVNIMLCDIEMPQGSGLELLAFVKEQYPSVVCILLTCHADFQYAKQAVQLGVLDYLLKPARTTELESVIARAIEIIKREKELAKASEIYRQYYQHLEVKQELTVVDKIKQYIAKNMGSDFSREDIAKFFHMNPDYLTRIFKKEAGMSISDYIIQERIRIAKDLLVNTNMPISEIVSFIGYSNFSHFSKIFKKATNMNPLDFRKKKQM